MKTVLSFRSLLRRVVLQRRAGDQEEKVFPVKDMEVGVGEVTGLFDRGTLVFC